MFYNTFPPQPPQFFTNQLSTNQDIKHQILITVILYISTLMLDSLRDNIFSKLISTLIFHFKLVITVFSLVLAQGLIKIHVQFQNIFSIGNIKLHGLGPGTLFQILWNSSRLSSRTRHQCRLVGIGELIYVVSWFLL